MSDTNYLLDSNNRDNNSINQQTITEYEVYSYRWLEIIIFILSGCSNALLLLTWSPITDLANIYWQGIGTTAINLLAVLFQICYIPGTLLALYISKNYSLRRVMIIGGTLNTLGCVIRYLGVYTYNVNDNHISAGSSYSIVFVGTLFAALAQPFYLNMPAKIANTWFAVKERDISTTLCSLANPLGSALGSLIPGLIVANTGESDSNNSKYGISGITTLLLVQLIISLFAVVFTCLFFISEPRTPPSNTASQKTQSNSALVDKNVYKEFNILLSNKEYVKLLISFTIALGNLNALAALLNQLPGTYSNSQVGITGFTLILSGFLGAFVAGGVLESTKAYRTILKVAWIVAVVAWGIFTGSSTTNNYPFFVISAGLLGFSLLPVIPATIMNSVECAYPIAEDLSVGLLYVGANTLAIAMTFIGQVLLALPSDSSGYKAVYPYFLWSTGTMIVGLIPIALYNGKYLRLDEDLRSYLIENKENTA